MVIFEIKAKTLYFSCNAWERHSHKRTYRSEDVTGLEVWRLGFSALKLVSRWYYFGFVLIDLSCKFSRSMVKAPNFYRSAFTQTALHVRWRVWSASVTACSFSHWSQFVAGTIFCLYSLTLLVIFQGQRLNRLISTQYIHTNGPTCKKERLIWKCKGLFFFRNELS